MLIYQDWNKGFSEIFSKIIEFFQISLQKCFALNVLFCGIIPDSFRILLFPKLFRHNVRMRSCNICVSHLGHITQNIVWLHAFKHHEPIPKSMWQLFTLDYYLMPSLVWQMLDA